MKKIALMLIAVVLTIACKNEDNAGFTISGTAKGFENGTKIYLKTQGETDIEAKDTATIENGTFSFKGNTIITEIGYVTIDPNIGLPFILENGKIVITIDKDSIQNNKISGTVENDLLQTYSTKNRDVYNRIDAFRTENMEKFATAQQANDTVTMNSLNDGMDKLQEELKDISNDIIKNNPKSFLSLILTERAFMQQFITVEEAKENLKSIDSKYTKTRTYTSLEKIIKASTSVEIGKKAPNFSAPSPDGKTISLNESLGKVTLIDFWASWCGPCRKENPNVVALYDEFHDKGFNIIGVSLDKDATKWKEAIEKDGLTWNHISNLKFWQEPIAETYNVKSIPATFLLDENGVIVARDLRGGELKAKVAELLSQQ